MVVMVIITMDSITTAITTMLIMDMVEITTVLLHGTVLITTIQPQL